MIGLVLWCDEAEGKAVFWCEDHGDLAFFDVEKDGEGGHPALCAGDMVGFDVVDEANIRRAINARLLTRKVGHGIQDRLLETASEETGEVTGSSVVRFRTGSKAVRNPRQQKVC